MILMRISSFFMILVVFNLIMPVMISMVMTSKTPWMESSFLRAFSQISAELKERLVGIALIMKSISQTAIGIAMMVKIFASEQMMDPTVHHVKTNMKVVPLVHGKNVSNVSTGTICSPVNAGRTGGDEDRKV